MEFHSEFVKSFEKFHFLVIEKTPFNEIRQIKVGRGSNMLQLPWLIG